MRRPLGAHLSARRGIGAVAIPTIRDRGGGFRIEGSADRPIGATFGSSASFEIGVVRPDALDSTDDSTATAIEGHLAEAEGVHVEVFGSIDELNGAIRRQSLSLGVVFADALDADLATGQAGIVVVADPTSGDAQAALDVVRSAVATELAPADAARFAASLAGASLDEATATATAIQPSLARVRVAIEDVGDARNDDLSAFSLTAPQNLVLFVFINAMAGGASLVRMRRMGVLRRVLAGPVGARDVVIGVSAAWFVVSLIQSLLIVSVGAMVFGVSWGDPLAAALLVITFLGRRCRCRLVGRIDRGQRRSRLGDQSTRGHRARRPRWLHGSPRGVPRQHAVGRQGGPALLGDDGVATARLRR